MYKYVNGKKVKMTKKEIKEQKAYQERWEKKDRANKYISLRQQAYKDEFGPTLEDQFDYIYHFGIENWRQAVKAIKLKYPKPS